MGLVLPALVTGCSTKNENVTEPVAVYVPVSCQPLSGARATYVGFGDFEPSQSQALGEALALSSQGFDLTAAVPTNTRDVILQSNGVGGWAGASLVPDAGPVNVLALPFDTACKLTTAVASATGVAMGAIDASHLLVVGGVTPGGAQAPAYAVDVGTGSVTALSQNTQRFRLNPTVTAFGNGVAVAGGNAPAGDAMGGGAWSDFEVFTPGPGGGTFAGPYPLISSRTQATGVVLPGGQTLLVGGTTIQFNGTVLAQNLEVIDPTVTPLAATPVSGPLHPERIAPTVLVLPTGQVFVGGGANLPCTLPTGPGQYLSVAWLTLTVGAGAMYQASWTPFSSTTCFPADASQTFAATESGAVLAVIGAPPPEGGTNVMLLSAPPNADPVAQDLPPLTIAPVEPALFPGPQASPVLFTGSDLLRWDPWTGVFTAIASASAASPVALSTVADGMALWIGQDKNIWTFRFDTRGTYATDVLNGPYFTFTSTFTAPDRGPDSGVTFKPSNLSLASGSSVFVTDATYADFTAAVTVVAGSINVVLRDPTGAEVTCPVSSPATNAPLARSGGSVTLNAVPCAGTLGARTRVSLGLRGTSATPALVSTLTVTR